MTVKHTPGLPKAYVLLDEPARDKPELAASSSKWHPNENYHVSLKRGMSGWDVWAIQIALNARGSKLTLDGVFGAATEASVLSVQAALGVTRDGIMGPQTQSALCVAECASAEERVTPKGLLKGICLGESGGIIPATSTAYSNGSRDYGPLQDNLLNPSEAQLREAFNPRLQAHEVGEARRSAFDFFLGQPGAPDDAEAWRLAVLSYNWPAAANEIAAGRGDTWTYTSSGKKYHLSDSAPWIEAIGAHQGARLIRTGWEWCTFYINTKVVYVTSWSVS